MDSSDLLRPGQVGDGPRNSKHPMKASRGQAHGSCRVGEKLPPGLIRRSDTFQHFAVRLRVRPHARAVVAVGLELPCKCHPVRHLCASFGGRGKSEIGCGHALDVHVQVYAVEQRAGNPRLIVRGALGRPAASQRRITQMAAPAGVHCRYELHTRREGDVRIGAGNADIAGFEGLPKRIEYGSLEFRQLVKEQDAEVSEADLARTNAKPACERAKDDVPPGLFGARNRQKKMTPYPQKTSPVRNRRQLTSLVSEVASRWTDEQLAPRPLSAVRGSISVPPRGPLVPFESSIERDFLMFCRTSHRVTAVHAQRLVIDFQDVKRGAARRYTPDFVVEVAADAGLSWRRAVVEVKTHRDLWRSRRLMRAPYAAARTWAAGQEGTIFRVVTDRMMSGEWLSSTRLLSGHLDKPFDVQFEQDCVAFLQQRDSYRISEILALAQQRGLNPQALLPVLYRMVARGQLSLDRGQPIGPQTWVAVVGSQKRL